MANAKTVPQVGRTDTPPARLRLSQPVRGSRKGMTSDPGFPLFRRLDLNYPATCHSARGWDLAGL